MTRRLVLLSAMVGLLAGLIPAPSLLAQSAGQPDCCPPYTLRLTINHIRIPLEMSFELAPDGKGWLNLSHDSGFATVDGWAERYVEAGRYTLAIGPHGYDSVRAALEPYISGPERDALCDGISGQARVTLVWRADGRQKGVYFGDLGCLDLARRLRSVLARLAAQVPAAAR